MRHTPGPCYNTNCQHPYCAEIGKPMEECERYMVEAPCSRCGTPTITLYDRHSDTLSLIDSGHKPEQTAICDACYKEATDGS